MDSTDLDAVGVLKHYGVLGMRWGFRKSDTSSSGETTVKVRRTKQGTLDTRDTKGGSGRDASDDAITAAVRKQIAASSGSQALDNKELQELITRMNLEQQYKKLTFEPSQSDRRKNTAKMLFKVGKTTVNEISAFSKTPAGKALREALQKSETVGKHRKT